MVSSGESDGRFDEDRGQPRKLVTSSKKRKKTNKSNKLKQKRDTTKRGEAKIIVQRYDSELRNWCATCALNNSTQEFRTNVAAISMPNGICQGDIKEDVLLRISVEPELASIMAILVEMGYAGAPTIPGNLIQLASIEQHYYSNEEEPFRLVEGQELVDLQNRRVPTCRELDDYDSLPITETEFIQKLGVDDQIFFTIDVSDPKHKSPFKNIRKSYLFLRVQVYTEADGEPSPHFIAFILKGEFYYIFGGEGTSPIYKIRQEVAEEAFFEEENRNTLLSVITASWEKAVYCVEDDYVGHQVIFIPKAILRDPSDMWDEMSIDEIKGQNIWEHGFIDIQDPIPRNQLLAYSIVELKDPGIIDVGEAIPK